MPRRETFAGVPAPYVPMSVSGVSPTKKTPLSPPHIPILQGSDCISCHGRGLPGGGLRAGDGDERGQARIRLDVLRHLPRPGKSFYVGAGTPLQLRPADHVSSTDPAMATGDCSQCHETKDWVSTTMPAGHMPNPASLPCSQCMFRRRATTPGHARGLCRPATRASTGIAGFATETPPPRSRGSTASRRRMRCSPHRTSRICRDRTAVPVTRKTTWPAASAP